MSKDYRYAIIGTGFPYGDERKTGFGMAHSHWENFSKTGRIDLVAISDLNLEAANDFKSRGKTEAKHYFDYKEMLKVEKPEIVSVTTWPHLHAEMSIAAFEAGVKAVHCEKPMATKWGDAKRMKEVADAHGGKLTFGHQRRFIHLFQAVRQAIREGEIGELVQLEASVGDMFDWGTHWLDMMFFYNEETPAEWVIGQIDSRTEKKFFGAYMENQAVSHFKFKNGVRGILIVGHEAEIGCVHRIIGKDGMIEVLSERKMRILGKNQAGWKVIEIPQEPLSEWELAPLDVIRQLDEPGYKSLLSVDNAIQHTELIFGTYLSSQLRARVDLPIPYDGNSFLDMLEKNEIGPGRGL